MARKQKTTPFEDLIELASYFPWWLGLILAVISYVVFHSFASIEPAKITDPKQLADALTQTVWRGVALVAQYFVSVAFVAGACVSAWRRWQKTTLVKNVLIGDAPDKLDQMSWAEFELLVGEAFRLDGFEVEQQGGSQADGGIDLVLRRGGEKLLVQCKQWRAMRVGVDVVRELYGVMAARGATGGFVVTSGTFTNDALEFAQGRNVILVDGAILLDMIERAERAPSWNAASSSALMSDLKCPKCRGDMVKRVAKKGANAGNAFWGCSRFPACTGTRDIS